MYFGNVFIIGDSYSTFEGYIPHGYESYYYSADGNTDVRAVEETWWHQLIAETKSKLILNDSWSGSTVCHTGYDNSDCSKSSSFVYRVNKHISEGFFERNKIDTIFFFGGTNDSYSGSPLGELKYETFEEEELFSFLPAVSYVVNKLQETAPDARIIYLINSDLKPDFLGGIIDVCSHYGVEYVILDGVDKISGHPTVKGMERIKNKILEKIT